MDSENSLGAFQRSFPWGASDSKMFLHLSFSWKWSLLVTRWNVCLTSRKGMDRQMHQRFPFFQFPRFYVLKTSCLPHFIGFGGREQKSRSDRAFLINFPSPFRLRQTNIRTFQKLPMATQSERFMSPYQCGETGVWWSTSKIQSYRSVRGANRIQNGESFHSCAAVRC